MDYQQLKQQNQKPNHCLHCQKKLVPIGSARKNGKNHCDWPTRQYHKKCWNTILLFEMIGKKTN